MYIYFYTWCLSVCVCMCGSDCACVFFLTTFGCCFCCYWCYSLSFSFAPLPRSLSLSLSFSPLSLCLYFLPCLTTLSRNQLLFRFLFCTSPFFNFLFACQSICNMLFIVDDAVSAIFPCYFRCFLFLRLRERRLHMQMSKNHSYTQMATTNGNNTYGLCPS